MVDPAAGVVVDSLEGQFKHRDGHRIGTHQHKSRLYHRDRRCVCPPDKRGGGTAKADQVDHSKRAEMGRNAETIAAESEP